MRVLPIESLDRLSFFAKTAEDEGFSIALDYCGVRNNRYSWLFQIFSAPDVVIVAGRGRTCAEAVDEAYQKWLGKVRTS
jgi:hypothetical protein